MSGYRVFFGYNNGKNVMKLPVNPEQIEVSIVQSNEKYEILKLGQIVVPGHMELKKYSFECELPHDERHYIETRKDFRNADWLLQRFEFWRNKKVPFRFVAGRVQDDNMEEDSINSLALIEEMTVTEKAGEEGDKYVSFNLVEYREYDKKIGEVDPKTGKKKAIKKKATTNPKSNGYYIVKSGDTLSSIAKKQYNDASKYGVIFNANKDKIKNPNLIKVGQKLLIPPVGDFAKYSQALPSTKTKTASSTYKVPTKTPSPAVAKAKEKAKSHSAGGRTFGGEITHSGGGRVFEKTHSGGGRTF